uniref:Putative secreted peptide n=1 Tax=Anopheles braziliensis TaxID=58242 RepID=A0A2M3ZY14_9DIPT
MLLLLLLLSPPFNALAYRVACSLRLLSTNIIDKHYPVAAVVVAYSIALLAQTQATREVLSTRLGHHQAP